MSAIGPLLPRPSLASARQLSEVLRTNMVFGWSRYARRVGYLCPDNAPRPIGSPAKDTVLRGDPNKTVPGPDGLGPDRGYLGFERAAASIARASVAQHGRVEAADLNSEKGDYRNR